MAKQRISLQKVFKEIIWPRRKYLLIGLILIIINRLSGLVLPGASKYLMDDVIVNEDYEQLKLLVAVVISSIFMQALSSFMLTKVLSIEAQRLISELRAKVQKHIISLPVSFFDNTKSGELVSRIMSDVEGVRNLVGTGLVQLIGGTITAVISTILLVKISLSMTLFVLVPVSIFGIVSMKAFKSIRPIFRKRGQIKAEVTGRLTESLNGVRVIKGFNAEQEENRIFEDGVQKLFNNIKKSMTATAIMTSSSAFLLGLASTGIMGIGGYKIMQGELTVGDFLSFTLYLGFMVAPIVQMSNIGSQLTEAFAGLDRTEEIMNQAGEQDDPLRTEIVPQNIKGDIKFENVSFEYEEDKEVLHNISFEAKAGSITALVGSSGSGKTTIASLAASFLNPSKGQIYLDHQDLRTVHLSSFRQHLGVVLQDDFLFEGSIKENILFSNPTATDIELENAIKNAYVDEFTNRFDEGIHTIIGERGVKLSGGQRQRIAIARAIIADPQIIILDEATSSLDTESEALIQESLSKLMKGRTTIVIAHRLSTIQQADQILVMDKGEIIETGTHDVLLEKKGRYYKLYKYQARI
ncbi:ABC transporter ATP-binding protein [Flammeovirga aprica]|uniref:ABC transporter ATP-binding protein n=1 Tax=Flammeovirga aprica JL-4 TaxID=694437 RepID=A0A7X9S0G0_9BACT|nr:ABC transporter ATP-binding protein [Flammeovirga aprica]NME72138.1 ABC transporter ATP-binding protein [Flammeovirga aprica JL-4]